MIVVCDECRRCAVRIFGFFSFLPCGYELCLIWRWRSYLFEILIFMWSLVSVGNIPYDATEEQLVQICEEVGPVVSFRYIHFSNKSIRETCSNLRHNRPCFRCFGNLIFKQVVLAIRFLSKWNLVSCEQSLVWSLQNHWSHSTLCCG